MQPSKMICGLLLMMAVSGCFATDKVTFTCDNSGNAKDILYEMEGRRHEPLNYEAPTGTELKTQIVGKLKQDIDIVSEGGQCHDLVVKLKYPLPGVQLNDKNSISLKSDFENMEHISNILCQDIPMTREIRYTKPTPANKENPCLHMTKIGNGDPEETKDAKIIDERQQTTCSMSLGLYFHNPLLTWLQEQKTGEFPVVKVEKDTATIDWGLAKRFNCHEKVINVEFDMKATKGDYGPDFKVHVDGFKPTKITTKGHDLRCFPWDLRKLTLTVQEDTCIDEAEEKDLKNSGKVGCERAGCEYVDVGVAMACNCNNRVLPCILNSPAKKTFSKQHFFPDGKKIPASIKAENAKGIVDNTTSTLTLEADNFQCVKKEVEVTTLIHRYEKGKKEITPATNQVDLRALMPNLKSCEEYLMIISMSSLNRTTLLETTVKVFPTITLPKLEDSGSLKFEVNEAIYQNCEHKMRLALSCRDNANDSMVWTNSTIEGLVIEQTYVEGKQCVAKVFIQNPDLPDDHLAYRNSSFCFTEDGNKCSEPKTSVTAPILGSIGVFVLIVPVVAVLLVYRKKKTRGNEIQFSKNTRESPSHLIFQNDDNLPERLDTAVALQEEIVNEYEKLETFVKNHLDIEQTTVEAKSELNRGRNRYQDMVPYDNNIAYLSKETGDPKSKYINASWVNFTSMSQQIVAVQAPKTNMFSGFWQLVVDQKVSLIVMITKLVENQKRKAHQYWPDEDNVTMKLENRIKVTFEEEEAMEGMDKRTFELSAQGQRRKVVQLQCTAWPDMEAPKDTKTLLDLMDVTDEVLEESPGTILVHCSAGVGRTGTYIGLYKLIMDYKNKVNTLDPFETVLSMRKQRVKMVQKPLQYHYMIKCFADHVVNETSEYV